MNTPSQTLAARIIDRFIAEGLVTATTAKKLQPLLADGKLSAEDWRLPIELAREKEAKP
jgi:hypothetical protein